MLDKQVSIDQETKDKIIENPSRRKAVKTLAAGAGALAAYHTLPVNWSTPIIDQIFLPAHAQTSGIITDAANASISEPAGGGLSAAGDSGYETTDGHYRLLVEFEIDPPIEGVTISVSIVEDRGPGGIFTDGGETVTGAPGPWSFSNGIFSFEYTTTNTTDFVSLEITGSVVGGIGSPVVYTWTGP